MQISKIEAVNQVWAFIKSELQSKEWYQKIKGEIKTILLYGSVAKGTNTEDSDIDIMIILPLENEKEFTRGEYIYDYGGNKINIVLRSIEKLRAIDFAKDEFQKEVFRDCEFLMESDDEVRQLLASKV